jgi:hypothetical protein
MAGQPAAATGLVRLAGCRVDLSYCAPDPALQGMARPEGYVNIRARVERAGGRPGDLLVQLVDRSDDAAALAGSLSRARVDRPPSVRAAVDLAARSRPDLVILRVPLDEVAGADALRRLHAMAPACRVVVLPCRPLAGSGDDRSAARGGEGVGAALGLSGPPSVDVEGAVRARALRPRAESAGLARQIVLAACRDAAAGELRFDALLVCTELVSNAVTHARTAVGLTVRAWPTKVRIEVRDHLPERPALRPTDSSSSNGRGLAILSALCSAWGIDPAVRGKTVWAELVSRASSGP